MELRNVIQINENNDEIKASEFKATCLKLMDAVAEQGNELTITKNGQPVAKLVPYVKPESLRGIFKGEVQIIGDIIAPVDQTWDDDSNAESSN
ncbi:MAG: type II toxin-antitoxin system Phd/YefM family antitoxin [Gammaproteobacteria bacterium]|nr:type II toxin-antitoxin system Phd/YefM family antitoxin [Gammaproteobacteria bacterium]